jgi:hypothetical protein
MADIKKRNYPGNNTQDAGAIDNLTYSNSSGARKTAEVGRHLLPFPTPGVGNGYTTDLSSAAYSLPGAGRNLAVYNNSGSVASITFGSSSAITALAAGATDSSGNVGLPCQANAWSYFAAGYSNYVISSSSSLLVFLINDDTSIQAVAQAMTSSMIP